MGAPNVGLYIPRDIHRLASFFIALSDIQGYVFIRTKGFKIYVVVAVLSSFSFGVMHFFYEPTTLLDQAAILPKFAGHFAFGLILSGIFWFVPHLRLLIFLHSLSNLYGILTTAAELT